MTNSLSPANLTLSLMGQLGGPIAAIAMSGLKAAMTAHNFTAMAQAFENMTPSQRAALTTEEAFNLSNPPDPFGLSALGLGPRGYADPMGQKESAAFQAQRAGERAVTPNAPDEAGATGIPGIGEGVPGGPAGPGTGPNGAGPGGGVGGAGSGAAADVGVYANGGYVKNRVPGRGDNEPALLTGGEFVIRREVVKRHRKLLEHINAKAR